jgi:hypothetical protein
LPVSLSGWVDRSPAVAKAGTLRSTSAVPSVSSSFWQPLNKPQAATIITPSNSTLGNDLLFCAL